MKNHPFPDPRLDRLARAGGFTPEDLDANRIGNLSRAQVQRLRWDQRRQYWPSLFAWSLLGALVASLGLMRLDVALEWIAALLGIAVLAVLAAYELRLAQREIGDEEGEVAYEVLRVDEDWKPRYRLSVIEFQIGPRWFTAPRAVAGLLDEGQEYRLYFAKDLWSYPGGGGNRMARPGSVKSPTSGSYRVLSLEPIGPRHEKKKKREA